MEIRLPTDQEMKVLRLLHDGREMYGLEIVDTYSGEILRSSIYVILTRMRARNLVTERVEKAKTKSGRQGSGKLRLYRITDLGRKMYHARAASDALILEILSDGAC